MNTDEVVPFNADLQHVVESLSALAAIALAAYIHEQRLRQEITRLRIEVDEGRNAHKVAEITETDYLRQLQRRPREARDRSSR